MNTANKILAAALSLGLILSPIASVGAKDESKEAISPQKARVGTGVTAGRSDKDCDEAENDEDGCLKVGYIITGIAAAALLAIILEIALDGKKDRGVTPPGPGPTPPTTTPPATTPTTTTTTATGTGN